jgi:hypothetical protein
LKSYHQRGYFCRNTIMSSGGRKSSPDPPAAMVVVCAPDATSVEPPNAPTTIAIGITVKMRNAVVRRLRSRSGYSTSNWSGYCAGVDGPDGPPAGAGCGWSIGQPCPLAPANGSLDQDLSHAAMR